MWACKTLFRLHRPRLLTSRPLEEPCIGAGTVELAAGADACADLALATAGAASGAARATAPDATAGADGAKSACRSSCAADNLPMSRRAPEVFRVYRDWCLVLYQEGMQGAGGRRRSTGQTELAGLPHLDGLHLDCGRGAARDGPQASRNGHALRLCAAAPRLGKKNQPCSAMLPCDPLLV